MPKISQLFLNVISYGAFNYEQGCIRLWNDLFVFVPIDCLAFLQKKLYDIYGEESDYFMYWLGKVNGRNGTELMVKKFGINPKNFDKFVEGATFDGYGKLKLKSVDLKNKVDAVIIGENSPLPQEFKRLYPNHREPVDFFVAGEISGGGEPLFKKYNLSCKETKCIAKGNKNCEYHIQSKKEPETLPWLKKVNVSEPEILQKMLKLTMTRKGHFKTFAHRNIRFGDGSFVFNGIKGVIILDYVKIIMDVVLFRLLKDKYFKIVDEFASLHVDNIYDKPIRGDILSEASLKFVLEKIAMFGYGYFSPKKFIGKKLYVQLTNNFYGQDYRILFGKQNQPVDYFQASLLKALFKKYAKKDVQVKETTCVAQGQPVCVFEISGLK